MLRSIAIVLFAATAAVVSAQAPGPQKGERPGVTNYTRVDAVVACGGATTTAALDALKADGFKAVINLRLASEAGADIEANAARAKALGLKYLHIPFDGNAADDTVFDAFLAAVAEPANQPVYVHCASANRVGAVWLAKRVLQDGWTVERATEEARFIGLRNPALEQRARQYIASKKP